MSENLEIKPSVARALILVILEFALILGVLALGVYLVPKVSGIDFSFFFDFVEKDVLTQTIGYSIVAVFVLVIFLKVLELSTIRLVFLKEGFEYHHGRLIRRKKEIFYSNVIRVNYTNGILDGEIALELSGTDILSIRVPHVVYPGAAASRIKKMIDDSVSQKLFEKIKDADKSIEEETAERIVGIVKSRAITKENIAVELERAADGEKLSKNIFEVILAHLLESGRLTKNDLSAVMFSLFERGLITKKDIADVLFYLNRV